MPQILAPQADLSAAESRMAQLDAIIRESLTELTRENILNYIAQVQRHYTAVINLDDVMFWVRIFDFWLFII